MTMTRGVRMQRRDENRADHEALRVPERMRNASASFLHAGRAVSRVAGDFAYDATVGHAKRVAKLGCSPLGKLALGYATEGASSAVMGPICDVMPIAGARAHRVAGTRSVSPAFYGELAQRVERCGCGQPRAAQAVEYLRDLRDRTQYEQMAAADDADLGAGELGVDAAAMWKLATEKLYRNNDLVALATREAMQNGVDAIRMAYRARGEGHIPAGTGVFSVSWQRDPNGSTGTLTFEDNGVGMDAKTLRSKFLVLGATGKGGETGGDVVGGFGMAKAVILGVAPEGDWEVHTRDVGATPVRGSMGYNLVRMPWRQGTKIVLRGIPATDDWSRLYKAWLSPGERVRRVLAFSDVTDLALMFNGADVQATFSRRKGSYLDRFGSEGNGDEWGAGNTVTVKNYRRSAGEGKGYFYVRLAGLFQFVVDPSTGAAELPSDIVIDIASTNRPSSRAYPLNASRDDWNAHSAAAGQYADVASELIREHASASQPKAWETLAADSENEKEREGAADFADAMREVMEDPEFSKLFDNLTGGIADFYESQKPRPDGVGPGGESNAPGAPMMDSFSQFRDWGALMPTEADAQTPEGRQRLGTVLQDVITAVEGHGSYFGDYEMRAINATLNMLEAGRPISPSDASMVLDALKEAQVRSDDAAASGRSDPTELTLRVTQDVLGTLLAAASEQHRDATPEAVARVKAKARRINPFGTAGVVKIRRGVGKDEKHNEAISDADAYDRSEVRRFLKNAKKYIPYLVMWDLTLHIIATEGKVKIPFKPGFVLDHGVRGIATTDGTPGTPSFRNLVLVEPEKLGEVIKAHKERPWAIASYLHQIASHEMAHLPRMGKGHDEKWAIEREDLGASTAHMLPAIERMVATCLGLAPRKPDKEVVAQIRAEERERANEKIKGRVKELRAQIAEGAQHEAENVRLQAVVGTMRSRVDDIVNRVQSLIDYHDFRDYLRGPGAAFLPVGVTAARLLAVLDENPLIAVDVLLGAP